MNRNSLLLRLVLLVSFSHATVHLLEQSIASVELDVSSEFQLNSEQSGLLSTSFRIPYGFGALLAGMLADRIGARRILAIYLGASACICLAVMLSPSSTMLYISLFCLGCFASIYHPAGLALLANSTTPYERPRALGLHGVLGSTGIMSAPLIAGLTLSVSGATWKTFYAVIAVCCAILTWMLLTMLKPVPPEQVAQPEGGHNGNKSETETNTVKLPAMPVPLDRLQKRPFALMVTSAALCGIVYGGFLHFLTRYLTEVPQVERLAASFGFTGTASARFCS
ncbi:MAG: MFS transporter, partial [Planctomycetaceae bacterium]|nr:MFS transporter [Planctomycetaceae bacterium]